MEWGVLPPSLPNQRKDNVLYEHEEREKEYVRRKPLCDRYPVPAPELDPLFAKYLQGRRLNAALAMDNGWYSSTAAGDSLPRVVIPAASGIAGNCFWQARLMGSGEPRYQSPHAARGDALVVVHPWEWNERIVVVEGPMDALVAAMYRYLGIALMGLTPSDEVLGYLKQRIRGFRTSLVADGDQPAGMVKILGRLVGYGCKAPLTLLVPYPFKDLCEAPSEERERILSSG